MIDLYSDTKTRPTDGMRRAIATAEVGDEQRFEDPTINRLRERVCELLGKEDAVFLPSGTMCNEIALAVHCRRGEEVLLERSCHIVNYEAGGPGALAGVVLQAIDGVRGTFTGEQVKALLRPEMRYLPRTRLVCVEQTANAGGGRVWPQAQLNEVARVAHEAGLKTHMDGARLMNAVVASGVAARAMVAAYDSVWLDFSKGLGCPVGAMLAGTRDFISEAWRLKQQWGGAMRQSGILGAAALYALDHHVDRLAEDHANARYLAEQLAGLPGVQVNPAEVDTNLVYFDVTRTGKSAAALAQQLKARGVEVGALGPFLLRAVTHLDVTREQVTQAVKTLRELL